MEKLMRKESLIEANFTLKFADGPVSCSAFCREDDISKKLAIVKQLKQQVAALNV
ncbi:hypothetical protein M5W98_07975 [Paenibacillus apiarius]|nr:hypothetical protein [Paenibacillus apiarius]